MSTSALKDEFAMVREASLRSLLARGPQKARMVLQQAAKSDVEPRLRELAKKLAAGN